MRHSHCCGCYRIWSTLFLAGGLNVAFMCKFICPFNDVMCLFNDPVSPYRAASEIKRQASRASLCELSYGHHQGEHMPVRQWRKRVFSSHFYSECRYLGHLGVADTLICLLSRRTPQDEPLDGAICYSTAGDIQAAFPKCSVPHQAGLLTKAAFPLRWRQRRGRDTDRRCENVTLPPNMWQFLTTDGG